MLLYQILGLLLSYLCGAIPFGLIVTRVVKGIDVRDFGSGSSGFTNVYRVAGIGPGIVVAGLDIAKGMAAVMLIAGWCYSSYGGMSPVQYQIVCGFAAVVGHIFTIFARFRGGKGVLVALGVCVGLIPMEVAISTALFVAVFALTRYISVGSLAAAASLPLILIIERFLMHRQIDPEVMLLSIAVAAIIFYAHRQNISRLIRGEENRFRRLSG